MPVCGDKRQHCLAARPPLTRTRTAAAERAAAESMAGCLCRRRRRSGGRHTLACRPQHACQHSRQRRCASNPRNPSSRSGQQRQAGGTLGRRCGRAWAAPGRRGSAAARVGAGARGGRVSKPYRVTNPCPQRAGGSNDRGRAGGGGGDVVRCAAAVARPLTERG